MLVALALWLIVLNDIVYGRSQEKSVEHHRNHHHGCILTRQLQYIEKHLKGKCIVEMRTYVSGFDDKTHIKMSPCLNETKFIENSGYHNYTCSHMLHILMDKDYNHQPMVNILDLHDKESNPNQPYMIKLDIQNIENSYDNQLRVQIQLDKLLIFRPWWKVHSLFDHSVANSIIVILERYPVAWRPFLNHLVSVHYANKENCIKTPIIFGRHNSIQPGIYTIENEFTQLKRDFPHFIFDYYWPSKNGWISSSDCTFTIDSNVELLHHSTSLNKRICAFLPLTNCTIPTSIKLVTKSCALNNAPSITRVLRNNDETSVINKNCLNYATPGLNWKHAVLVDKAHSSGRVVDNIEDSAKFQDIKKSVLSHQTAFSHPPKFQYILPFNRSYFNWSYALVPGGKQLSMLKNRSNRRLSAGSSKLLTSFASIYQNLFLSRPNGFYRHRIDTLIHETRQQYHPHFTSTSQCVAVHIRRGEKSGYNVNMTQWCINATHDINLLLEMRSPKRLLWDCQSFDNSDLLVKCPKTIAEIVDYGCLTTPFGAITLQHVIDKVRYLVSPSSTNTNLLVLTDDPLWLQKQILQLKSSPKYKAWKIFTLLRPSAVLSSHNEESSTSGAINEGDSSSNGLLNLLSSQFTSQLSLSALSSLSLKDWIDSISYYRYRNATENGVTLYASLKLVKQCKAFIGHFGSGISSMLYSSMCIEHSGLHGVCPPYYDFQTSGL